MNRLSLSVIPRLFHFRQPAGTSRGVYTVRLSWLIKATDGEHEGWGESAPLPDLSSDAMDEDDYTARLRRFCGALEKNGGDVDAIASELASFPSMLFGLETAILSLAMARRSQGEDKPILFDTPFSRGEEGIPVNGLVWMGSHEEMLRRLETKIRPCRSMPDRPTFRCVKIKIGAIDFNDELSLIKHVRERFSKSDVELRVDANGAFTPEEAPRRLEQLARYDVHSIEQPIRRGQWREMAALSDTSPLPIALDEELIGLNGSEKRDMLDEVRPRYIVIKPSLHGGMRGTREWVALSRDSSVGSWITSAMESNIGLNSVAQLAASIYGPRITFPQGLGLGTLFNDNIPMPLETRGDMLWMK